MAAAATAAADFFFAARLAIKETRDPSYPFRTLAAMPESPAPPHATPKDLFARLDDLGIAHETHRHPPVFTVEEAQAHCAHLPGGHCKNLFLKDKKGQVWLVVAGDERPIDMKELRHRIGAHHLSFAKPDLLMEVLGVAPGSVTPFALINDAGLRVNVVLDAEMMRMGLLNFHPLSNDMTTAITPDALSAFIAACGHSPRVVAL